MIGIQIKAHGWEGLLTFLATKKSKCPLKSWIRKQEEMEKYLRGNEREKR